MKKTICAAAVAAVLAATGTSGCVYESDLVSSQNAYSAVSSKVEDVSSEVVSSEMEALPGVGMTVESDDWKISLLDAKQYKEIAMSSLYINTPDEGKEYLVLFFEAENISGKDDYFNYLYFESYVDDYNTNIEILMGEVDGYSTMTGDVAAGKKIKGYIAWEVSTDWQELEVTYNNDPFGMKNAATFLVTPDQVMVVE